MAEARWNKYKDLPEKLLEIIRETEHPTTNKVKEKLEEQYNLSPSWTTVKKYLNKLEENNYIKSIKMGDKNEVNFWDENEVKI